MKSTIMKVVGTALAVAPVDERNVPVPTAAKGDYESVDKLSWSNLRGQWTEG